MYDLDEGKIKGKVHHYKRIVCFHHTDAGKVVYHSRYLDIAEEARGAFLRLINCAGSGVIEDGDKTLAFAIRNLEIGYLRPAQLQDIIEVRSFMTELKKASISIRQEFYVNDSLYTTINLRLACMDIKNGRPNAIPTEIREKLESYIA